MIKPTIGHKVWFWPSLGNRPMYNIINVSQPLDATIVYVHNDSMVNLAIIDHLGHLYALQSVKLAQESDPKGWDFDDAEWTHYQAGQAQKVGE
jgi:hypothetical protein